MEPDPSLRCKSVRRRYMRRTLTLLATLLVLGAAMPAALAGGWALTAFDSLPEDFEAGETYALDYTVLQHGETPVDVGESEVVFTNSETGETITFVAVKLDEPGRYTVEVTIPTEGVWGWRVSQGMFESHEMGVMTATAAAGITAPTPVPAPQGVDLMTILQVALPMAAVLAAIYTIRALARSRGETASTR
jgi:hypothetical protein